MDCIKSVYAKDKYVADTHTAVAWQVAQEIIQQKQMKPFQWSSYQLLAHINSMIVFLTALGEKYC